MRPSDEELEEERREDDEQAKKERWSSPTPRSTTSTPTGPAHRNRSG